MMIQISIIILGLLLGILLGGPSVALANRLKMIDMPGSAPHKTHAYPTPLAGGILLVLGLSILGPLFQRWLSRDMVVVFCGAAVIFLFGMLDDYRGLSAFPKLIGQFLAAMILIVFNVQVHFVTFLSTIWHISPLIGQILNIAVTLVWLIGITNAMNMIDSMDGIVSGLGVIAFACFAGASKLADQTILSVWSAALIGISASLYFGNKVSGKFFLGDSGAQTLGFLLACFGILYNPLNRSPESSWVVPIMLLGVPIFDTTLVVVSRLKRGQPVGSGRRDHTYHRLIALGFSPNFSVVITHLTSLSISCLAFLTLYMTPFTAISFFLSTIVLGILALAWLERRSGMDGISGEEQGI